MLCPVKIEDQQVEIRKTWSIFHVHAERPISLRAIWPKGFSGSKKIRNVTFTAKKYPNIADRQKAFEDMALKLNAMGYNIYIVLNPIDPSFAGDEENEIAVGDAHIASRRYLFIDLDRAQTDQPATDDEMDEVFRVAGAIEREYFFSKGRDPITVNSGNGAHIYLPIDLPNDGVSKLKCQQMLQSLAAKYDTTNVKVDQSVYTASRITKVPGCIARKGLEVPDDTGFNERYYRMVSVLE